MRRTPFVVATLAVLFLGLAPLARAESPAPPPTPPPLADKVPDEAYFYFGWCGADALAQMPAYQQSHLKGLLDTSNMRQVATETLPRVFAKIAQNGGQDAAQAVDAFKLIAGTIWQYPTAGYFTINFDSGMPMPHAALFCRAGKDAAGIEKRLDELLSKASAPPEVPIRTFVSDDIVGIAVGFDDGANALVGADGKTKPLIATPGFSAALAKLGGGQAAWMAYYDNDTGMSIADRGMQMSNQPELIEKWTKIKNALGLNTMHRVIGAGGFDGQDWSERVFVDAPMPRKGIMSAFETTPVPDEMLQMVPSTAVTMAAGGMNLSKSIEEIRGMLGEIDPEIQTKFNQALGIVQMYTAVNLEKDLFASLGEHWVVYDDPKLTGGGGLGFIVVNKLTDPAKAQRALTAMGNALTNTVAGFLREKQMEVVVRQVKSGDITVNYLAVPFVSPCWTIKDGYLYLALYPQNAIAAARMGKPKSSILENAGYIAMRKRLGVEHPLSLSYDDLPAAAVANYQSLLAVARIGLGAADLFGIRAPELVLPPMQEMKTLLAPAGQLSWADDQGFYARSVTPFPGASLVSGPPGAMAVAAPAMMAGVLLPSLNRARETANRVKCASNERQIGQAILLYSNDNKGQYPPDLGTLVITEDITPEVFLCPDTSKSPPPNWAQMNNDQKVAWINANADYVYIGAGMNNSIGPEAIVVYEHERDHGRDGINLLYGDGHVEFQRLSDAQRQIQKAKKK